MKFSKQKEMLKEGNLEHQEVRTDRVKICV